jgi:ABC-2 type transport system ATP-binding protein
MDRKGSPLTSVSQSDILLAEGLWKSYGQREALRGLSFSLRGGRVLGFLGPNGAGKTTSIRILTTMLRPDAGRFFVDGISNKDPDTIRRKIGVLPENLGFPRQMTGIEYLTHFGRLYGRSKAQAKARGLALLEEVGLQQRARSQIGTYSHGMRQRIGIARALVNDPVVVFLDEPTLGLDPRGQKELLALIRRIVGDRSVGVVLCSHALWEVENTCDDVVILSAGQVVATGTVADVIGGVAHDAARQTAMRVQVPPASVKEAQRSLEAIAGVASVSVAGESAGWLVVEPIPDREGEETDDHRLNNLVLQALMRADIPVLSFGAEGSRLQDVFLELTEEAIK